MAQIYKKLLEQPDCDPVAWTYLGCCCFFLGMYQEADDAAMKGPQGSLQNRLQFHVSHKVGRLPAAASAGPRQPGLPQARLRC
jgi:intraflagellar transport protein 56